MEAFDGERERETGMRGKTAKRWTESRKWTTGKIDEVERGGGEL